MKYDP